VPGPGAVPVVAAAADRLRRLWQRLGLPVDQLARLVVTPTCGLAGASPTGPQQARAVLAASREVARQIADDPEGFTRG
jgi:hypothetical protein